MKKITFRLSDEDKTKIRLALIKHSIGEQHFYAACTDFLIYYGEDKLPQAVSRGFKRVVDRAKALSTKDQ